MSETEETAKAVQEASKFGSELVKQLPEISRLGSKLLGPFGEGYGILTDLVRHAREEIQWRFNNRRIIYQLAAQRLKERCLALEDVNAVPPRIAFDVESGLEREDEPSIQVMWANLIANLCCSSSEHIPNRIIVDTLTKLDADTAAFFNEVGLRAKTVRLYFIVCGMDTGGVEIEVIAYGKKSDAIPSTELMPYSGGDNGSIYCPWSESKVNAIVDALCAVGLLRREREQYMTTDAFLQDEDISPSRNYEDLGVRIIQNMQGVEAFGISDLGEYFYSLVCHDSQRSSVT